MVDSEGGSLSNKSLVEHLEEAPKKFFDIMTTTSKNYLTHTIGIVKSYLLDPGSGTGYRHRIF